MKVALLILLLISGVVLSNSPVDRCYTYIEVGDVKNAIKEGLSGIKLYPKNPNSHYCLGIAYQLAGMMDKALGSFKKAESLATNKEDFMLIYNRIGFVLAKLQDYNSALHYYMRSLSLARSLKDIDMQATLLHNMGSVYDDMGMPDKALSYYTMALELRGDSVENASTYNNIALIYANKGNFKKAEEFFKKSIRGYELAGNYRGVGIVMLNLGIAYRNMKKYELALKYVTEGLNRVLKAGDLYWTATGYLYLGWLATDAGMFGVAVRSLENAYKIYVDIGANSQAESVKKDIRLLKKLMRGTK